VDPTATSKRIARSFRHIALFGVGIFGVGIVLIFWPRGASALGASLLAAGGLLAVTAWMQAQRWERLGQTEIGLRVEPSRVPMRTLTERWLGLALINTMVGILVSTFAIVAFPPPLAVALTAFMALCIWVSWRFYGRVRARDHFRE
jgi:drug/metabolite transporter (DMT)-like permease